MKVIDSHQHFWQYDPIRHNWITPDMAVIRKDFLPHDLAPVFRNNQISGCISVQVDQNESDTLWMLQLASENDFIKGVVGWVDLQSSEIQSRLAYFSSFPLLKGFRHILQAEEPGFLLGAAFMRGIAALKDSGFTYDILVLPRHLEAVLQLVAHNPEQAFVIDHAAKPDIISGNSDHWKKYMSAIAKHPRVFCKISGMVTEADWKTWQPADLTPYLDFLVEHFGTDRLLFGSDWPVCLVASSYDRWFMTVRDYFSSFTTAEQEKVFFHNAIRFYNL